MTKTVRNALPHKFALNAKMVSPTSKESVSNVRSTSARNVSFQTSVLSANPITLSTKSSITSAYQSAISTVLDAKAQVFVRFVSPISPISKANVSSVMLATVSTAPLQTSVKNVSEKELSSKSLNARRAANQSVMITARIVLPQESAEPANQVSLREVASVSNVP